MSKSERSIYQDGNRVGKIVERDNPDGSHKTTVEEVTHRDIFGNDSAEIVSETTWDKNGNISIKTR